MKIPFTIEQFLSIFQSYNYSVWPMQVILFLLAIVTIYFIFLNIKYSSRIASIILSFLWLWMGIVYHLQHFTSINETAYLFGFVFIMQGLMFFYSGFMKSNLTFRYEHNIYGITGSLFVLYALLIYPILAYNFGHNYPKMPTFGVPCPTVIFTFGILLWMKIKTPKYLLIIPFLWSLIGFSAAINLQMKEDFGLIITGLIGLLLILLRERNVNGMNKNKE